MARIDKPWRVYGARLPTDYRTERAAYEAVQSLRKWGFPVRVYHWEDGAWHLYERFAATEQEADE